MPRRMSEPAEEIAEKSARWTPPVRLGPAAACEGLSTPRRSEAATEGAISSCGPGGVRATTAMNQPPFR